MMTANRSSAATFLGASGGKRILLVDDDLSLRQSLAEQLRLHEEFATAEAESGAAAIELCKKERFDAIILDVGLPDMDGREVCRVLRRNGVNAPVIMLTGADTDADAILGLDSGANDYVTKPFRMGVLLARIRAQLRQHEQSEDATFAIGPYNFRPSIKLLLDPTTNRKVRLTEKETAILKYLYRAGERACGVRAGGRQRGAAAQGAGQRGSAAPRRRRAEDAVPQGAAGPARSPASCPDVPRVGPRAPSA